jgi:hypothetical protein
MHSERVFCGCCGTEGGRDAVVPLPTYRMTVMPDYTLYVSIITPEQGPLLEYPPNIKYAESWLFLYNIKNHTYIFPYNASEYAL